jgi:hypothetical protein
MSPLDDVSDNVVECTIEDESFVIRWALNIQVNENYLK